MGLSGWQWLFIIEGVPSVWLWVLSYLTYRPREAAWLELDERIALQANPASNAASTQRPSTVPKSKRFRATLSASGLSSNPRKVVAAQHPSLIRGPDALCMRNAR
jgi:hypothetical protein